jgi:BirA family biotin operon repressor/biotin-[acetyl-CoA-carboxylase] ligase
MDEGSLRAILAGLPLSAIYFFKSIGSTNDFARSQMEKGGADGILVVADEQTQGRGRLNRHWVTAAGAGLAFSLLLRPSNTEFHQLGLLAPLWGVAVCRALREQYQLNAEVKWPNDVLINRRKACGILVEAHWLGRELEGVVAGIGVNVAPSSVPRSADVLFPATCVESELGRPVKSEELLAEILKAFFYLRPQLGSEGFFETWQRWLAFKNEWVRVEGASGAQTGQVVGISHDGSLRLRAEDGTEVEVAVGDVSLRPE